MTLPIGKRPRIALIGAAGYALVYIEWLIESHNAGLIEIAAATILPSDQDLPSAKDIRSRANNVYADHSTMFEKEAGQIDICFIPTGIQWHTRMTIAALEAGCNVLVEKPLAGSVADVETVREAEKRCGRWVAVGFQDMYTEQIFDLKKRLLDGVIGDIETISMMGAWPRPKSYFTRNHWAGKLSLNGVAVLDSPLNNAFAHFVNLSLFLASSELGQSVETTVDASELLHAHEIESFDTAIVQATAKNGVKLWLGATHATDTTIEPCIRIDGSAGTAIWEHEKQCEITPANQDPILIPFPKYSETRARMFHSVIDRLCDDTVRICDSSIAKRHTQLIETIHRHGHIQSVSESDIEEIFAKDSDSPFLAIKDIVTRLKHGFENASRLSDGATPSLNA